MKPILTLTIATLPLLCASCGEYKPSLPIKTSMGDLVRVEMKASVETNKDKITPKEEEALYQLSFEGVNEISYDGNVSADGPNRLVLVDAAGKQFSPVYTGTPANDGALSDADWKFNGNLKSVDGKWVFVGTVTMIEPKFAAIYRVPKGSTGLVLKDGDQRHRIN